MIVKGTTSRGFKFKIDINKLETMEFIELLNEINENDPIKFSELLTFILGKEQKKKFYASIKNDEGLTPIKDCSDALEEIFNIIKQKQEVKN